MYILSYRKSQKTLDIPITLSYIRAFINKLGLGFKGCNKSQYFYTYVFFMKDLLFFLKCLLKVAKFSVKSHVKSHVFGTPCN